MKEEIYKLYEVCKRFNSKLGYSLEENKKLKEENSSMRKKVDKVASDGLRHGSSEGAKHLAGKRRK